MTSGTDARMLPLASDDLSDEYDGPQAASQPASTLEERFGWLARWGMSAVIIALGFAAYTWNHSEVFVQGAIFFVNGDAYRQMSEAASLIGMAPGAGGNAGLLFDLLVLVLAIPARLVSGEPLAMAGAWISPLLGIATLTYLAFWTGCRKLKFRHLLLLIVVISPILSQAFLLGRPGPQSLMVFLLALALTAEVDLWNARSASTKSAIAWGLMVPMPFLAPVVILVSILVLRLATGRLAEDRRAAKVFLAICLPLLIGGALLGASPGGFPTVWPPQLATPPKASIWGMVSWVGWLPFVGMFVLFESLRVTQEPVRILMGSLLLFTGTLGAFAAEWGIVFAMIFAISLPWVLSVNGRRLMAVGLFLASISPLVGKWQARLAPDPDARRAGEEAVAAQVALRDASLQLRGMKTGLVVGPWDSAAAISWWSGQPCLTGSPLQNQEVVSKVAEFFLTEGSAAEALQQLAASYVVVGEPEEIIVESVSLLNRQPPKDPLCARLHSEPPPLPLLYRNGAYKIFSAGGG